MKAAADWRTAVGDAVVEYPRYLRAKRRNASQNKRAAALKYQPGLRQEKKTRGGGPRQLRSSPGISISDSYAEPQFDYPSDLTDTPSVHSDPFLSFISSRRSGMNYSPQQEDMMLLRRPPSFSRTKPVVEYSSRVVENDELVDPFVSLCLRHDCPKALAHEKPGFSSEVLTISSSQQEQIRDSDYSVSITVCPIHSQVEEIASAPCKDTAEETHDPEHAPCHSSIDDLNSISMYFPSSGEPQPEETSWMSAFSKDASPEEEIVFSEVLRYDVEEATGTVGMHDQDYREEDKSEQPQDFDLEESEAESMEGDIDDQEKQDSYLVKMVKKLLPNLMRITSCCHEGPETTAETTSERLMKMVDNIDCGSFDDDRNSYAIIDAFVFEKQPSILSSSSTASSSSSSISSSSSTYTSGKSHPNEDRSPFRLNRLWDLGHHGAGKEVSVDTGITGNDVPRYSSNDDKPNSITDHDTGRAKNTSPDPVPATQLKDTLRDTSKDIKADVVTFQLAKEKKWHRKLGQARQKLLFRREPRKFRGL